MGQLAQGPSKYPAFPTSAWATVIPAAGREVPEVRGRGGAHLASSRHPRPHHAEAGGALNVAILNCWGKMRSDEPTRSPTRCRTSRRHSWLRHSGSRCSRARVNVRFISFDDVGAWRRRRHRRDRDRCPVTPFSRWLVGEELRLWQTLRAWVHWRRQRKQRAPTVPGSLFQLGFMLGVTRSVTSAAGDLLLPSRRALHHRRRTRGEGVPGFDIAGYRKPPSGCGGGQRGELGGTTSASRDRDTFPVNEDVTLLRADGGQVQLVVNEMAGRSVYVSGSPYSAANACLLSVLAGPPTTRAACGVSSSNPSERGCGVLDKAGCYCVVNVHGSRAVHCMWSVATVVSRIELASAVSSAHHLRIWSHHRVGSA